MQYGFLPFATTRDAGGHDIRDALRSRQKPSFWKRPRISNLGLLDLVAEHLQSLPYKILVDFCTENDGDLHLAVYSPGVGHDIEDGDRVNAGFFVANSESCRFDTTICERIYRMACVNGALVECERTQTLVIGSRDNVRGWDRKVPEIVRRAFENNGVGADIALFRKTTEEMIATPYEILCNLVAQCLITEEEQSLITAAFNDAADLTLYGVINAITNTSHRLRENDDWVRSVHMERLGGQIIRGDHRIHSHRFVPV